MPDKKAPPTTLKKYAEKRHFDRTPEPPPEAPAKGASHRPTFCVQRHHASHLHYDFRLEVDGVLKSWAVPKGPTLDPSIKRLAMMVEDHPLEYGAFEGNIPKGNYGGGSVMLWDRGTYEVLDHGSDEEQIKRGDFKFHLNGQKLNGDFALVRTKRGKGNEWLLLKKKDSYAAPGWDPEDHSLSVATGRSQEEIARDLDPVKRAPKTKPVAKLKKQIHGGIHAKMPENISPMLAEIGRGDDPPSGEEWLYEVKWDGVRAICYIKDGHVRMLTRNGRPTERQYPELSILPHQVGADEAILDGEIVALDGRGLANFELLQRRINVTEASAIATLARSVPVVLYVFDVLYVDGKDVRGVPLIERKHLLKELLKPNDLVRYSEHFPGKGKELLEAARVQGVEGVVGKKANSFYTSRRSSDWVKWKITESGSFVLCGFIDGERDYFGALVLGVFDHGKLTWAGNVGTGFDRKMMKLIFEKLEKLITDRRPLAEDPKLPKKVTWVNPEVVCEVRFSNWTEEGRLRAPVFAGLRPDLDPEDCVRENGEPSEEANARQNLLDPNKTEEMVTVDGHKLKFTNLNKLYFAKDGFKKRDLLEYYNAVAPLILPHLKDRPLSLKRYPNGIDADFFFQKEVAESFPGWLRKEMADGIRHVIGEDKATLLFLVNLGCIDHNPWMSRIGSLKHPDYMLIDLDPYECGYDKIVEAALLVRAKLDQAELESYPKTTGGDGMHLFVPLEPRYSYEQVRSLAELLAGMVTAQRPDLFTTPRAVSRREKGRVYFDWAQIAEGKTISAPYVIRPYEAAPVATPLDWSEVTPRLDPKRFNITNALNRFDRVGDLFEGVLKRPQRMEHAIERLSKAIRRTPA